MSSDAFEVEVIRSERRKRTSSARLVGTNRIQVRVPAGLSPDDEQQRVAHLVERLKKSVARPRPVPDDDELRKRADELNRTYFGGSLHVESVRYVSNQATRYGSCTPSSATIRISDRLASLPAWVRDYILVHELAHLVQPNHSKSFWRLVRRYKKTERAIGYLMAWSKYAGEDLDRSLYDADPGE